MSSFGTPDVDKMKANKDVMGLIKALSYVEDANTRQMAAMMLGEIGDARAVKPLIEALKDKVVVFWAVEALGKIGDPSAIQPLIPLLQKREKSSTAAFEALGRIGGVSAVNVLIPFVKEGDREAFEAAKALVLIGTPAVEPLINVLKEREGDANYKAVRARTFAVYALGEIGDLRAMDPLLIAVFEGGDVSEAAAKALGKMGNARAVDPLIAMLENKGGAARKTAAEALGKIGDPRAIEPLIAVLNDSDDSVHKAAVRALERFDDPQARDALVTLAGKKPYEVDGMLAKYTLKKTCLDNPFKLEVKTEKHCVYCDRLSDPNLREPDYPKGAGYCSIKNDAVSFDDTCENWMPNARVRFWLSKGYMEHNLEGWPRVPWYQVFDDGPDGEKGTR
jgi:HEAT repeat protein